MLQLSMRIWLIIVLLAATFIAYWPALHGGILWDDDAHITRPALQSIEGLGRIWFELGATQQYYPVLHTAFWIEHHLWGDSTLGYHILNVLLHVLAAGLFGLVLSELSIPGAWVGAFIFALHPVGVESVAWISEQKNTLSLVFYLAAMLLYLRHHEKETSETPQYDRSYYLALGLFIAAILSKSVTATLPAAILVILWWKRGKLSWNRDVMPLLPWFGVGIAGGLLTAWVERRFIGAEGNAFSLSLLQRVLISGRDVWFYLQKLVWPSNLMFIYPRWDVNARVWWQYLFPLAALVLLGLAWLIRGRTRGPLAALLFFVGSLFPALGFFNAYPFIYSFVADHFQYLASLGIIALTVGAVYDRAFFVKVRIPAAIVLIAILGIVTRIDAATYRDAETLYKTTYQKNPGCWMCYNNLGLLLFAKGQLREASALYTRALQVKPDYAEATNNLGVMLSSSGFGAAAFVKFEEALRMKPDYADAHNNLANLLVASNRPQEAMPHLEKALQLKPDYPEAKFNLGAAMLKLNRPADAITNLKDAVRLKPNYAQAHGVLGIAWYTSGQLPLAKEEFEQAVQLNPKNPQSHRDLGETLLELGQTDEALSQFETALKLDPENEDTHKALAKLYAAKGRPAEAAAQYEHVLRLKPDLPEAHNEFAVVLETLKKPQDALQHFQEAIRLKPDYTEAHYNLGLLLASIGRKPEGISEFKSALKYDPNNAQIHDALGAVLYDSGRFTEALAEFTETQRLKPDLAGIQSNLELARRAAANGR